MKRFHPESLNGMISACAATSTPGIARTSASKSRLNRGREATGMWALKN